jgi:hypothetical protein
MTTCPDISIPYLATVLEDAAIDCEIDSDGDIYITSTKCNMWVKYDTDAQMVVLTTYRDLRPGVSEIDALRLANHYNSTMLPMCQFAITEEVGRFCGAYGFDLRGGFSNRQFLRSIRMFSDIFAAVIHSEEDGGVLQSWRGTEDDPAGIPE